MNSSENEGLSRRLALQLSAVAIGGLFAGCFSSPASRTKNTESTNQTDSYTNSPTSTTPMIPKLKFSSDIVQQPSTEAPAMIEASLSNLGTNPVEVGFGPALMYTDNSEELEWNNALIIDPETRVGPWDNPIQTDGCWRFPEDGERPLYSTLEWRELAPQESLREQYSIYTFGSSSPCLPEGVYRYQDKGYFETESRSMIFTLVIEIDENKKLATRASGPDFQSE